MPGHRFSTAGLPPEQQFDAYAAATGRVFEVDRRPPDPPAFVGELAAWGFGSLVLRRTASDGPLRSTRTPLAIRRDQMDHSAISAWGQGTHRVEMAEHGSDMQPGHIHLDGPQAPGRWERGAADWNMLFIPRDSLPDLALAVDAEIGRSRQLPLAPPVWSHIDGLDRPLHAADTARGAELAAASLALPRALLGGRDARAAAKPVLAETARRRVIGASRANLGSARLNPARLAALSRLSRTRLCALFDAEGEVARVIQRERQAAVAAALADPQERRSIAELAARQGAPPMAVPRAAPEGLAALLRPGL